VLADIRSGGFARRMQAEQDDGSPALALIAKITAGDDPMTRAESAVRAAVEAALNPARRG
jgi:hypothetical protein